jgi:putative transposase
VSHLLISLRRLVFFCFHVLQHGLLSWIKPPQASLCLEEPQVLREKSELIAENALLRQQLIILRRQIKRLACCAGYLVYLF